MVFDVPPRGATATSPPGPSDRYGWISPRASSSRAAPDAALPSGPPLNGLTLSMIAPTFSAIHCNFSITQRSGVITKSSKNSAKASPIHLNAAMSALPIALNPMTMPSQDRWNTPVTPPQIHFFAAS